MWKLRPPWPSFMRVLILLTILMQTSTVTHQLNTPRVPNEQHANDTNRDVDKLNDHPSRLTSADAKIPSSYNSNNNEETAVTLLPSINNKISDNTNTSIIASIHDRNQHHHRRKLNNNKDKRRKRKKKVHEESLLSHKTLQHHTINNNNSTYSINSHNNHIKPKSNSIATKNNDDFVELIDEIDELEFNNGTFLQTNVRRKKDGYYHTQPNGVVVYRRYKCVPKTSPNQQSLIRPRPTTTYSSQYPPSYGNQRWRQWGMYGCYKQNYMG